MQSNLDLLRTMKTINSELIEPIQVSFGPCGLGIMLADEFSTVITRRGLEILEYLEPSHPLHSWILRSARNLGRETGDGVKTYVLYLAKFMDQLKVENRREFVLQLKRLIVCLDKFTIDLQYSETDPTLDYVTSFFFTRFPCHVYETIARLTSDWIASFSLPLSFLLTHFDCLVNVNAENCNSVAHDLVIPGRYIGRVTTSWKSVVLAVFHLSEDSRVNWKTTVNRLQDGTSYLIVTNSEVSSKDLIEFRKREINLIHLVPEYFSFFLHELQCLKYSEGVPELFAEFSTGSNLMNPSLKLQLGVYRLNLSAPTKQLVKNFNQNVKDCLVMLRFSQGSPAIATDQFDRQLAAILSDTTVIEPSTMYLKKGLNRPITTGSPLSGLDPLLKDLTLNSDFVSVVVRTLMAVAGQLSPWENPNMLEPLRVRLVVLSRALTCIYQFLRVDCILPRKQLVKSTEIEEEVDYESI